MKDQCLRYLILCLFILILPAGRCLADDNRKGFIMEIGLGFGNTNTRSNDPFYEKYSASGLAAGMRLGYAPTNRSAIMFGYQGNIFLDEVGTVWKNWYEKMQGDDLVAVGAILLSPFVFGFSPIVRSHLLFGSLDYTHFLKETSPSLLFSGAFGMGLLYDKFYGQVKGGYGISAGTGYELGRKLVVGVDLLYTYTANDVEAMAVMISVKKYFY